MLDPRFAEEVRTIEAESGTHQPIPAVAKFLVSGKKLGKKYGKDVEKN